MKIRELSYKVGDEVFPAKSVISVEVDGIRCRITYSQTHIIFGTVTTLYRRTIECPPEMVEVFIEGK